MKPAEHIIYRYQESTCFNLKTVFKHKPPDISNCIICGSKAIFKDLNTSALGKEIQSKDIHILAHSSFTKLFTCKQCGWWVLRECGEYFETNSGWDYLLSGVIKSWPSGSKDIQIDVIRRHFIKRNHKIDLTILDATAYEKQIQECLCAEFGPCEVHHVGVRRQGANNVFDLFMIKDQDEWLIQIKRSLINKPESVQLIRNLHGALFWENKAKAILVSSAQSHTGKTRSSPQIMTSGPYVAELLDRGDIVKMIEKTSLSNNEPWQMGMKDIEVWKNEDAISLDLKTLLQSENIESIAEFYQKI